MPCHLPWADKSESPSPLRLQVPRLNQEWEASANPIPSPQEMFRASGNTPDPWQSHYLDSNHNRQMVLACRRAGKSFATAIKTPHHCLTTREALAIVRRRLGFLFVLPHRGMLPSFDSASYLASGFRAFQRRVVADHRVPVSFDSSRCTVDQIQSHQPDATLSTEGAESATVRPEWVTFT